MILTQPYDAQFLQIESAAHQGAHGHNPLSLPTEAQHAAGNYKKGRLTWQGLRIAIEQPRGSYRSGMGADGKRWATRLAAHYGYFEGVKGADGDELDCFIGPYPQAEAIYLINQQVGGRFDEHKAMLCFDSQDSAERAYRDSYDRGWTGLHSVVAASVSQFKWWLKNGDKRRPMLPEHLPHEGSETMMNSLITWDASAQPVGMQTAVLLYQLRCHDAGAGLLLDAVTREDILEDADEVLAMDAMVTPYAKVERKMDALYQVMQRASATIKPIAVKVTEPFKPKGISSVNVAGFFELSDGQTISVYLHNPDTTPQKLAPTDELISWKWLLNKKDITIVVAPERGEDLNVREVARRIMKLAEKNSAAFQRVNAKRAERMQAIQGLKDEITALEAELAQAQRELEVAKVKPDSASPKSAVSIELTGKELGEFPDTEDGKKAMRSAAADAYNRLVQQGRWVNCPALSADVELRTKGRKKMISSSADSRKLKIVPKLKELIFAAKKVGNEKPNYDAENSSNIVAYQTMRSLVVIDGIELAVRFVLGRDDKGQYHYDHTIHGRDAVFDSAKANGPAEADPLILMGGSRGRPRDRSAAPEPDRLLPAEPSAGHQDGLIMDKAGSSVNATASGSAEVLNLFFEGEDGEVVVPEEIDIAPALRGNTGDAEAYKAAADELARQAVAAGAESMDPIKDYLTVRNSDALKYYFQDALDSAFGSRMLAVRNELRGMGWDGEQFKPLSKNGATLDVKLEQVGAGRNVVGVTWTVTGNLKPSAEGAVTDTLEPSDIEMAREIDAMVKPPEVAGPDLNNGDTFNTGTAKPQADPQKDAARAMMQAIIDGTTDPLTADLDALEVAYLSYQADAEIAALFERAVDVVMQAEAKATEGV